MGLFGISYINLYLFLNVSKQRGISFPFLLISYTFISSELGYSFFDYHIAADPTLLLKNPIVFKTGRLIQKFENRYALPEVPTIGSFGFVTAGKGFEKLVSIVQKEFDNAIIRLNIPFATFGDADGSGAHAIAKQCEQLIVKPNVKLIVSHQFLTQVQVLEFLAQNYLNAFFILYVSM